MIFTRRSSIRNALLAAAVLVTMVGSGLPGEAAPLPTFTDVTVTHDIAFRDTVTDTNQPITLALDLYEGAGDTRLRRPLVIWIHGGSFAFGDKADLLDVAVSSSMARLGVVAASINYRLGTDIADGGIGGVLGNPQLLSTIVNAMMDAREAIRFMREHADEYRIDPDQIFVAGASAGAVTSLNVAYLYDNSDGITGGPTDPYRVAGALSFAGTTLTDLPQPGEPPVFMAHGTNDTTVPYAEGLAICNAAMAVGIPCQFESYPTDHMGLANYAVDITTKAQAWLQARIDALPTTPPPSASALPTTTIPIPVVEPAFTG